LWLVRDLLLECAFRSRFSDAAWRAGEAVERARLVWPPMSTQRWLGFELGIGGNGGGGGGCSAWASGCGASCAASGDANRQNASVAQARIPVRFM
jgi:hypothetical protein